MDLLDILTRRKRLLSYDLVFDSHNRVSVRVSPSISPLPRHEHMRLWAEFYTEAMRVLGYPENITAVISLATLERIVAEPFDTRTDCFDRAGLSDIVRYTEEAIAGGITLNGRLYSKGLRRILIAHFPAGITEKYVIYGAIGLLQYVINRYGQSSHDLRIVLNTVLNLIFLLRGKTPGVTSFAGTAYALAAGLYNSPGSY